MSGAIPQFPYKPPKCGHGILHLMAYKEGLTGTVPSEVLSKVPLILRELNMDTQSCGSRSFTHCVYISCINMCHVIGRYAEET
jgi:hypothetical protein